MELHTRKDSGQAISMFSLLLRDISLPAIAIEVDKSLLYIVAHNKLLEDWGKTIGSASILNTIKEFYDTAEGKNLSSNVLETARSQGNNSCHLRFPRHFIAGKEIKFIAETLYLVRENDCSYLLQTFKNYEETFLDQENLSSKGIENLSPNFAIQEWNQELPVQVTKVLDCFPDIICTIDSMGFYASVNLACNKILGYHPALLEKKLVKDFVTKDYQAGFEQFLLRVMSGKQTTVYENEMLHASGEVLSMIWSASWNAKDELMYCTFREAAEKVGSEQRLIESEKRFRALVHDGSDMIAILDETANYLYVSPSSKTVLDLDAQSFIGRNAFEYIHPDDIEKANQEFASAAGQKKVSLSPFRFRHNNGSWRWVQTIITDLRDSPAVRGFVANSRDVTNTIEIQSELLISNERYSYVGKATSDAIWDWDLRSDSIRWGEGFTKLFGYAQTMLNSDRETWKNTIHPLDVARVLDSLNKFLSSERSNWREDYKFLKANGEYAHVVDKGYVIRDSHGKAIRMIGAVQDITLRKNEEARLRVLESVVTNTVDAVLVADIQPSGELRTKISFVNHAFEEMTGYCSKDVIGHSPWFLQGSGTDKTELKKLMASIKDNKSYMGTITNYKKDGTQIWVSYSATPVADSRGNYAHWIAILRDVSLQKRTELQQTLLADISLIFNNSLGFKETLRKVLVNISAYGRFGFAAIWTKDPILDKLQLSASYFADEVVKASADPRISMQQGDIFAEQIRVNPFWTTFNLDSDSILDQPTSIKLVLGIPLFHHKSIVGVLLIGSMKSDNPRILDIPTDLDKHLGTELHRKRLERDLYHIFNVAPDIIAISDFSGNFKKLNPAASKVLGYSMKELLSHPFNHFLHPEDRQATVKELDKIRRSGKAYYIEERYLTAEGRTKWLAWTSQPLAKEKLIYSVAKDITEKKELEDLLQSSNSLARIGSWELSYPDGIVSWSKITREILNAQQDDFLSAESPFGRLRFEQDEEGMKEKIARCFSLGEPWDETVQIITYSGDCKWVRTIGSREFVGGKCLRLYGSLQDINLQRQTEISVEEARVALEESEKRYSELFHLSPLPMWVYEFDTLKFLDVNQTAVVNYGYSREEFLNMDIRDIRPEEDLYKLDAALKETRMTDCSAFQGTFRHRRKNGEIMHVDIQSNIIVFKGRKAKIIVSTDITERLQQFQAIQLRNDRLREIAWIQSHKVRAPLAKIMGLVNLLTMKPSVSAETLRLITYIDQSANELDEVIMEVTKKSEELNRLDEEGYVDG
ncbi:PAS domain S-box protein [Pedobacter lithocola]|uniref:histidine kinase n=1 Tax=Pedobacter lithocola TaxID=1908239 RepID=A0ABV8PFC9_9SPHI